MRRRVLPHSLIPAAAGAVLAAAPAFGQALPSLLGSYCMAADSGTMGASITAAQPIFSFRYSNGATPVALIRNVVLSVGNGVTAFTAGSLTFDLFAARAFTGSDSGGSAATLTTNNGKLRTVYATTGVADFRIAATGALTAGTRTLDATQLSSVTVSVPNTAGTPILPPTPLLLQSTPAVAPLVLAKDEGMVLQEKAVPATGTWQFSVTVCWDEASNF